LSGRHFIACAVAAGVLVLAGSAGAGAATSAISVPNRPAAPAPLPRAFFGLGPASKTKLDGRSFFNWSATPGSQLSDHVAVVNFGITAVTLRVFVTNAVVTGNGTTGFAPDGTARGGPSDWVSIKFPHNSPVLRLAPHSTVILPITIVIPRNAEPGDHEGAVIASLTSVIQSKHHAKVHFVQQVADRIITRISGKLHPQLSILGLHVAYRDPLNPFTTAPATVTFRVKNTGNELLGGKVNVAVTGFLTGSTETGKVPVNVPILLPGGSDGVKVTIPGVYPEVWMNAKVTIKPLVVTGQYDIGLTNYSAQAGFLAIPWLLLAILILIIGVFAFQIVRRRRRRLRAGAALTAPRSPARELVEEEKR
jgi:hypothetical protein